ncbi:2-isopropylmalate synthase [Thiomicrorhabdus sp. ZW0627]|uniref:2-isopropylmalate synthase n=1 Tax=Thiomicrorhabdus sp. ZW0627 TaxID=3039774 RepID=UPI0024371563|nr:2-isopropylmalate synthase [Thiomicrorhabdus sp. ZW0627]MDG6774224.1 2-isopropylmalate synthase [Thiomicrorhabdus sp. ZW0627]
MKSTMNAIKYRRTPTPELPNRQWPNNFLTKAPIWVSVDLRDGNQALANPMTVDQKLALWKQLVSMGFKTIEVGFPSASQVEFDFTRRLIEENLIPDDVTIQVLVQAREHLIARTYEALKGVKQAVVHVYNTTSIVQRENVFEKSKEEIKAMAVQGAIWVQEYAAKASETNPESKWVFQYSPESFSQTETDYAVEVCEAVMNVWQPTPENKCILNLPATVESTSPNRFADQVEYFITHLPNRESAIISIHTHNDRGCAVAAAELALLAGADRIEGTLLGNGERTGNMDIVTLAMNLFSEGIDPQLDLSHPNNWIPVVEEVTQIKTHPRHPWVGEVVYTAYSGSHQDAIRKCLLKQQPDAPWNVAYLPIDPKDVGRDYEAIIRVNSQSGKAGSAFVLAQEYGLNLPKWMQLDFAPVAQALAEEHGGVISHKELYAAFETHYGLQQSDIQLDHYKLDRVGDQEKLCIEIDGEKWEGIGNGTISALCDAWQKRTGQAVDVIDYAEHALHLIDDVSAGKNARAMAYVYLQQNQTKTVGVAIAEDSVTAMLLALLKGLHSGS